MASPYATLLSAPTHFAFSKQNGSTAATFPFCLTRRKRSCGSGRSLTGSETKKDGARDPHPTLAQSLTSSFSPLTACRNLLAMKSQGVRGEAELEREHMRIPELRDSLGILHVTKSSRSLPRGFAPPSRWIKRCVCPPGSTSPNGKCEQLNPSNTS